MEKVITEFFQWCKDNSWNIIENNEDIYLNDSIVKRYDIPNDYICFLKRFKQVVSADEKTWFLCCDDYNDNADCAFKWNEFELLSLESAEGDSEWSEEIQNWWNGKFPIIISVKDGYSFYAIDLCDDKYSIVRGEEPEFEEVEKIADDFKGFLNIIMENRI